MAAADAFASRFDDVRAYEGVLTRRVIAFCIDYLIVGFFVALGAVAVFLLGLFTLGLGFALYAILGPAVALAYVWATLGGPAQATLGMRVMGIRLERLDGGRIDGFTAVLHTVLFWAANVLVTPFVLLLAWFTARRRTLHDLLLGTVVVRSCFG